MARRKRQEVDRVYWTEGEGLLEVENWVKDGLYDKQIAKNIGITHKTFIEWKKKYELFNTVFTKARGVACLELVNATFKAAKGYYVQEQQLDNKGNKRMVRRWIPANVSAQIFLLKNWLPEDYKDKRDMAFDSALPVILSGDDDIAD